MSLRVVSLVSLLFVGFAAAGVVAPNCNTSWKWSFNSLGQNACTVAAYLLSTCHGGSYTIQALPAGYQYSGPTKSQTNDSCQCNTVTYSLLSACDGCQNAEWVSYEQFTTNCSTRLTPGSFPSPVPSGTRVPYWALDSSITGTSSWNNATALAIGDTPEASPGSKIT